MPPAIRMEKAMGPDLGTVCIVKFHEQVNAIFDQHDIAFQVIGEEVLDRESMAMHADVIAPALSILRSDPRLAKVEAAFQAALRELKPGGDSADAITDAGTALQEMLMAAGAKGKSLGPLLDERPQVRPTRSLRFKARRGYGEDWGLGECGPEHPRRRSQWRIRGRLR